MLSLTGTFVHAQSNSATSADPVLLKTMQQELDRAMTSLGKADPAPYFISYSVDEESGKFIIASNGALVATVNRHERTADVSVRVGNRQLDNTHGENRFHATTTTTLPLDDKPDAIARILWLATDRGYKSASQTFLEVKTNTQVKAAEEDASPDFSEEKPQVSI
ncbi:MAG TPA: peptidase U62, partial [Candidatus Angelobacter sp.]|nr:peptidase U62 [Candidatus Angelobacter sp.]